MTTEEAIQELGWRIYIASNGAYSVTLLGKLHGITILRYKGRMQVGG